MVDFRIPVFLKLSWIKWINEVKYHFWLIKEFANYFIRRGNAHSIQAPFLFQFYTKALRPAKFAYPSVLNEFENHRNQLLKNKKRISFNDLGAGSRVLKSKDKSIAELASVMLSSKSKCERLYRIAHYFQPNKIVEFGTSLGISTAYLAAAVPHSKVISIEGVEGIHELATSFFQDVKLQNINAILGDFDAVLLDSHIDFDKIDMVFIDGNHQKQKTLDYLDFVLEHASNECMIIFDDIRWSRDMKEAWLNVSNDKRIQLALDFFEQGIIVIKPGLSSQYFYLR